MTSFRSTFNWRNTSECKKLTILTLFLLNILHRFATVITVTIDTKTQFITTNTFISSTFAQEVLNFTPAEGYILWCSWTILASSEDPEEFWLSPDRLRSPSWLQSPALSSEHWSPAAPGAGLTSVCHHYRQHCDNQCHNLAFIITTKLKINWSKYKKQVYFPVRETSRHLSTGGWWGQHSTFSNIDFALYIATHSAAKHTNTLCKHCQPSWVVK